MADKDTALALYKAADELNAMLAIAAEEGLYVPITTTRRTTSTGTGYEIVNTPVLRKVRIR